MFSFVYICVGSLSKCLCKSKNNWKGESMSTSSKCLHLYIDNILPLYKTPLHKIHYTGAYRGVSKKNKYKLLFMIFIRAFGWYCGLLVTDYLARRKGDSLGFASERTFAHRVLQYSVRHMHEDTCSQKRFGLSTDCACVKENSASAIGIATFIIDLSMSMINDDSKLHRN